MDIVKTTRNVAEMGVDITKQAGSLARLAVRVSARLVPLPSWQVVEANERQREQEHHEMTAFALGSLFLKAKIMEQRGEDYPVSAEEVGRVTAAFCTETNIDITQVMDPHAGPVVQELLQK